MSILSDALKKTDKQYREKKKVKVSDIDLTEDSKPRSGLHWWWLIGAVLVGGTVAAVLIFKTLPEEKILSTSQRVINPVQILPKQSVKLLPKVELTSPKEVPKPPEHQKPKVNNVNIKRSVLHITPRPSLQTIQAKYFSKLYELMSQSKWSRARSELSSLSSNHTVFIPLVLRLAGALKLSHQPMLRIHLLQFARAYYPDEKALVLPLSESYFTLNQYQKGLDLLNHQSPVLSDNPAFYAMKGVLYLKLGRYAQARDIYHALSSAFPDNMAYALGLGVTYQSLKQYKLALLVYQNIEKNALPGWRDRPFVIQQIAKLTS